MENLIILFHILTALAIIGLILLQQGKGAEMGASFGSGASQTLFGSGGSGNFFSKMTAVCAIAFFVTSFSLAVIAKQKSAVGEDVIPDLIETTSEIPEIEEAMPADDLPEIDETAVDDAADDVPAVPEE